MSLLRLTEGFRTGISFALPQAPYRLHLSGAGEGADRREVGWLMAGTLGPGARWLTLPSLPSS